MNHSPYAKHSPTSLAGVDTDTQRRRSRQASTRSGERYKLQRSIKGELDREFAPCYSELGWATSIAFDYADGAPDTVVQVIDLETEEVLAYFGPGGSSSCSST